MTVSTNRRQEMLRVDHAGEGRRVEPFVGDQVHAVETCAHADAAGLADCQR